VVTDSVGTVSAGSSAVAPATAVVNVTKIDPAVISTPVQEICVRSDNAAFEPSRFYIQLSGDAVKIQQMAAEIKEPTTLLDEVALGMACIAEFQGDWYRAEIVGFYLDSVVVQ
jgi:hypothetical protein